ncbi:MAG: glycosyltransferase family 9 protein [Chthoniobacterales bacterium]|nr:glycosyltransferase family 9 protein [Chthoniobacterales bacterium]
MWTKFSKAAERAVFRVVAGVMPPSAAPLPPEVKVIAVFSCTGIGDGLFDSAAIRSLKLGHPGARVVVITHRRRMSVARHNPCADEVLGMSKSPLARWRVVRAFRGRRPDLVVALRVNEDAVPVGYLLNHHAFFGGTEACGAFSFLLSRAVMTEGRIHAVEKTLRVARCAGGAADAPAAMIYEVSAAERAAASERFADWINEPFIAWQVGGGRTLKHRDWPPERIIEAAQSLRSLTPHRIVLTGGSDNKDAAARVAAACPEAINLCCRTTLEETAAVVERAAMLVSSDTGVMHLGFAIGTPTLALLHPKSEPQLFGPPPDDKRHEVIHVPRTDAPGRPLTMDDLRVAQVTDAILRRLQQTR